LSDVHIASYPQPHILSLISASSTCLIDLGDAGAGLAAELRSTRAA
jgi:hypothetical protein